MTKTTAPAQPPAPKTTAPAQPPGEAVAERLPKVEMVASVRGFYEGAMVERGHVFLFDPNPTEPGGKPPRPPKWAAPRGQKAVKEFKEDKPADTRPIAAVAAAKRKAGQMGGAT